MYHVLIVIDKYDERLHFQYWKEMKFQSYIKCVCFFLRAGEKGLIMALLNTLAPNNAA